LTPHSAQLTLSLATHIAAVSKPEAEAAEPEPAAEEEVAPTTVAPPSPAPAKEETPAQPVKVISSGADSSAEVASLTADLKKANAATEASKKNEQKALTRADAAESQVAKLTQERDGAKHEADMSMKELAAQAAAVEGATSKVAAAEAGRDDALGKVKAAEDKLQETEDMVESITLDLEMEKDAKENMELEVEELQLRVAELEEDVLAAHDAESSGGGGGGEDGGILKSQNEKLRESLQRLYEASVEQQARIKELERENKMIEKLQGEMAGLQTSAGNAEGHLAEIAELKEALEEASEFSDFCEELTEKNLNLSEQIRDLQEQVEILEEEKTLQEEEGEMNAEELKEMQLTIDNLEVQVANSTQGSAVDHERFEADQARLHQCYETIKALQAQIGETAAELPGAAVEQLEAQHQEALVLNLDLAKKSEEAVAEHMNRELAVMMQEDLTQQLACMKAMLPTGEIQEDFQSIQTRANLCHIIFKGELILTQVKAKMQAHLDSHAYRSDSKDMEAVDVDTMARFITAVVDLLSQGYLLLSAFDGGVEISDDAYLKLGKRNREVSGIESGLDPMITALKANEVPSVDYLATLEELPRRLKGIVASEELTQAKVPTWWIVKGACEKLWADSVVIRVLASGVEKVTTLPGCGKGGQTMAEHGEAVLRRVERMVERVTPSSRLTLPEMDASTLAGAVSSTSQAARSFADACEDWEGINEMSENTAKKVLDVVGASHDTGDTTNAGASSCDTLLEGASSKLTVFVDHMCNGKYQSTEEDRKGKSAWQRRGEGKQAVILNSGSLQAKLQKAEYEANERLTALKRDEKAQGDLNAKLEVVTRRLEDARAGEDVQKKKIAELNEQDRMYQQAMDMLQDEILQEKQSKKALQDQMGKLESAKVAATLAPSSGGEGGGIHSSAAADLVMTIGSLQRANAALKAQLTCQHAEELNVVPNLKPKQMTPAMGAVSGEIKALKKDLVSLMACPKVVDLTSKASVPDKKSAAADPSSRFRQEYSAVYNAELRCKTLTTKLQQAYLKSQPGAAASTGFGLFASDMTSKQMTQGDQGIRVGNVRLPQVISTGTRPLYLNHGEFKAMHTALVN